MAKTIKRPSTITSFNAWTGEWKDKVETTQYRSGVAYGHKRGFRAGVWYMVKLITIVAVMAFILILLTWKT